MGSLTFISWNERKPKAATAPTFRYLMKRLKESSTTSRTGRGILMSARSAPTTRSTPMSSATFSKSYVNQKQMGAYYTKEDITDYVGKNTMIAQYAAELWMGREESEFNARKHGISFDEGSTVFADTFSLTVPHPAHSGEEERFVTLGSSHRGKLLVVVYTDAETISTSSAREQRIDEKERPMKKKTEDNDSVMQPHYDLAGGVRGKYARRYAQGTDVVVLEPDVARAFPNAEAVNSSLRALAQIIRKQKSAAAK